MATETDPTIRLEELYAKRQLTLEWADAADAKGLHYVAKSYRRSAAGILGAYNRIAKTIVPRSTP
jgi:hypothetical protein